MKALVAAVVAAAGIACPSWTAGAALATQPATDQPAGACQATGTISYTVPGGNLVDAYFDIYGTVTGCVSPDGTVHSGRLTAFSYPSYGYDVIKWSVPPTSVGPAPASADCIGQAATAWGVQWDNGSTSGFDNFATTNLSPVAWTLTDVALSITGGLDLSQPFDCHATSVTPFNGTVTFLTGGPSSPPLPVGRTPIAAGEASSFMVGSGGTAWGWGENNHGQLGVGTTALTDLPTEVNGLTGVAGISSSGNHTLAVLSNGGVFAWGANDEGQLGTGTTTPSSTPVYVPVGGVVAVASGGDRDLDGSTPGDVSLALRDDGTVWGWGAAPCLGVGADPAAFTTGIASAQTSGTDTGNITTPTQLPGLSNIVAISAGWCHGLALDANGTVWEFGAGSGGFPSGTVEPQDFIPWPILSGAVAIAAGQFNDVILRSDGTVWVFGGSLGTPTQEPGLSNVVAVSTGFFASAALEADGTVWVWGRNDDGELGNGTSTPNQVFPPGPVPGLSGVTAVAVGWDHLLALRADGTLVAWGGNDVGQLGVGENTGPQLCPYGSPPGPGASSPCSTVPVQVVPRRASLVYTGATTGDYNDPTTLSADLTDASSSAPLAGKTLTLALGPVSCTAVTDANGEAGCPVTPTEAAGTYPVTASFAGDGTHAATTTSTSFVVTNEQTTLTYTGDQAISKGGTANLSATLLEDGVTGLAGRSITFTLTAPSGSQTCAATTAVDGTAACTISPVDQHKGAATVTASVSGDTGYAPVSTTTSVTIY